MEAPIGFMVALNPKLFKSKISNCSQEGIFFESELNLLPGTVVFISSDGDSNFSLTVDGRFCSISSRKCPYSLGAAFSELETVVPQI